MNKRFMVWVVTFVAQGVMLCASTGTGATSNTRLAEVYGKVPLSFEVNQGQTDRQAQFLSRGPGYTLFLTSQEAVLSLSKAQGKVQEVSPVSVKGDILRSSGEKAGGISVLRMQLIGANPHPHVRGVQELPGKVNYFHSNEPTQWHTNIPTYAKVAYEKIYPGIDLIYYGTQGKLEYDFVVAPGADPKAIRFCFEGADQLAVDGQGDLILHTSGGQVRQHKPRIYQEVHGVQQAIAGRYVLLLDSTLSAQHCMTQQVGFDVGAYHAARPLVIDPVLVYSTYLGGIGERGYIICRIDRNPFPVGEYRVSVVIDADEAVADYLPGCFSFRVIASHFFPSMKDPNPEIIYCPVMVDHQWDHIPG
jgi:hypothetical protein